MRKILTALAALLVIACGDSTGPDTSHVGTYTLLSVDGEALPVSFTDGFATIVLTSGHVTLNADGTFADVLSYTVTEGTDSYSDTETYSGTYTRSGSNITFNVTSPDPDTYRMTLSGTTLTQTDGGATLVYRK